MKTLQEILKDKKISITSFAKEINGTSSQVCNWFSRGDIPSRHIPAVSRILNIKLEKAFKLKASNAKKAKDENGNKQ